ncbi:hypothetical protein A2917_03760 [Candidatus Nomurabacteria bacterium RIFCSPLOWO2_01_FULL_42_17]|uniref:Bacterial sugar transferase domain-containing protein n=1 Tax=Candidatus Nomurabacteria bacterium RIFCSPLOWO2_01_FULL_42_17 TaxID=1801780 RepID=A0A1F6XNB3_9BACT|nr:MAG: hypothetical protein A2917_03760 [Candidatus Nomurabacteria bacterium RIFCSPLOWO2_01_FULL_42_17]
MRNGIRTVLLLLGDIIMLFGAFLIMLRLAFPESLSREVIDSHLLPFLIVFVIWLFVFFLFNLYETELIKPTIPNLKMIGLASMIAIAASTILFYIIPSFSIQPKTNLAIFSVVFVLIFITWRRIFYNIFARYFQKNIAFIIDQNKDSRSVGEIKNYIATYPQSGFYVLGTYSSLHEFMNKKDTTPVDTLIVSKNSLEGTKNLTSIYNNVKNILDLTYAYENILGKIPVDSIDEIWFLHNVESTSSTSHDTVTYLLDKLVAFVVLIITFPILVIVALLIGVGDRGPIFYTQNRVGKGGKIFKLYKFRSMVVQSELNGAVWAGKNDNRITSIGKIIRKLHIDEIPQMINILKGELALVGPRPERPEFVHQLENTIPHYPLRHIIRPGFTGWAQIKYRYANTIEDSKEKFEYDLYYIKNRNIFMDLGIILRTIQIIFTH